MTASEAGGESVRGIGARLRAAREQRGLNVLQAAERLHVDARVLEALEAENFALLGADVYIRGHLRRYAEAVGESSAQLQELYSGLSATAIPDLTRIPRAEPVSRPSPLMLPALLLVMSVALGGVLWWVIKLPHQSPQPLEATPGSPAGNGGGADEGGARPAGHAITAPVGGAGSAAGSPPTTSTGETELGVRFTALSWVEISDAEGRRLLEGLYAGGSVRDVRGTAPLRVVLGNAPAVDLELNGRQVPLTGLVHRNGSAYLSIDRGGKVSAAAPRLAHGD
jgi:cytoskeleton protein RodZ